MTHRYLLSALVPGAADRHPEAVAATLVDATLTWAELEARTGRLAAVLRAAGVAPGDRVGIHLHKSLESLVAVHGVLRAGAAYVPIDPLAPARTVATIVGDCGIEVLVTHEPRRSGLDRAVPGTGLTTIVGLDRPLDGAGAGAVRVVGWDEVDAAEPVAPTPVLAQDLAYVMYTSGSTGTPKGIMHTHASGLAYATMSAELYGLSPDDRMANFSPLHFDMSTFEVLAGVSAGARVVLIPEPHLRLPASLTELVADQGCTTLYTVPSLLQQMVTRGALADRDRSAVRWVLPAGEVYPIEPLRALMALFPRARFANVYGPAEVNQCTHHEFTLADLGGLGDGTLPIGTVCADADVAILDDEDRPVVDGSTGQLVVRTATMMAGYWNRPDLDEAGFLDRSGPGGQRQRWYRTGDRVSRDDRGLLRYHGRADNQIKIRGNRVELEMVEAAVGSLDGVEHAVVGVRPDGAGDDILVVRYTPSGPVGPDDGADDDGGRRWRAELAAVLPPYAVPTAFESVDRFPLTPSGKIDRRTARRDLAQPDPTGSG